MDRLLENDRIRLRAPELGDLEAMLELENDPGIWAVSGNVAPYSRYQLQKYIETSAHDFLTDQQIRFTISSLQGGSVGGFIDLTDIDIMDSRAQVGIGVLKSHRGNGVGYEALTLLCGYARRVLKLHQLYAYVPVNNTASRKLFRKCGFSEEVLLKDWLRIESGFEDVVLVQKIL